MTNLAQLEHECDVLEYIERVLTEDVELDADLELLAEAVKTIGRLRIQASNALRDARRKAEPGGTAKGS